LMGDTRRELERDLRREFPEKNPTYSGYDLEGIGARTVQALEAPEISVSLPLDLEGSPFQLSVWQALRAIPPGQSATYSEIASRVGAPNAAHAVLQACLANRVAVAVPCHRALADGGLSDYRWGLERKRLLLDRETRYSADHIVCDDHHGFPVRKTID
jgi:AraC family transcriptional regulator of adaptative response/methylated-DNA-[protein]-cysteine methyltransferase